MGRCALLSYRRNSGRNSNSSIFGVVRRRTIGSYGVVMWRWSSLGRRANWEAAEFFSENPPRVWFADGASLDGNEHTPLKANLPPYDRARIQSWDWTGIDIRKESQGDERDPRSIQSAVIARLRADDYQLIFGRRRVRGRRRTWLQCGSLEERNRHGSTSNSTIASTPRKRLQGLGWRICMWCAGKRRRAYGGCRRGRSGRICSHTCCEGDDKRRQRGRNTRFERGDQGIGRHDSGDEAMRRALR